MRELRYTLVGEGTSDRALLYPLRWVLEQHAPALLMRPEWADLWRLPRPARTLPERIAWAIDLYPCDLLFVHRDADRVPHSQRTAEIAHALEQAAVGMPIPPAVCVVPVRMTEAWLLFDESALRRAAGNPNGHGPLPLPRLREVESLPDPKVVLSNVLEEASELRGRRLKTVPKSPERVAELTLDFAPLRGLSAFQALEEAIVEVLQRIA